jgi:heme/copper-type cytochrome/quinol oxidase subunit 1
MIKKYVQPEFLFLITGLLIVAYRLLFVHEPLDIAIHDTYILVDSLHITFLVTILFVILSFPYTLLREANKPLSKTGGWLHYILTMAPLLAFILALPITIQYNSNHSFSENMQYAEKYNILMTVSCMLCVLGQLVFLVNILVSLFKRKKKYTA